MNFLLDVNASGAVASWLIQLGHGVVEVGQKDPRMSDNEILSWAVSESRIIVSNSTPLINFAAVNEIKPLLDKMIHKASFWVNKELYNYVIIDNQELL
jgi:predicted nuclease of predicted toxin-antitoxin system